MNRQTAVLEMLDGKQVCSVIEGYEGFIYSYKDGCFSKATKDFTHGVVDFNQLPEWGWKIYVEEEYFSIGSIILLNTDAGFIYTFLVQVHEYSAMLMGNEGNRYSNKTLPVKDGFVSKKDILRLSSNLVKIYDIVKTAHKVNIILEDN